VDMRLCRSFSHFFGTGQFAVSVSKAGLSSSSSVTVTSKKCIQNNLRSTTYFVNRTKFHQSTLIGGVGRRGGGDIRQIYGVFESF